LAADGAAPGIEALFLLVLYVFDIPFHLKL